MKFLLFTTALLAGISGHMTGLAKAQQPREMSTSRAIDDARQIMLAAYPELLEGRTDWRFNVTATGVTIEARRVEAPFEQVAGRRILVSGTVVPDENGELQSLVAGGSLLEGVRTRAARLSAQQTGDLSGALRSEGAKFRPDDTDSSAKLVPPNVQRILAAPIARAPIFREVAPSDRLSEALTWQVDLDRADALPGFTLVLEPLEGRLMSITKR